MSGDLLEGGAAVDLLFTDVNMPGKLDGLDLARLVSRRWPTIGLVVTSGRPDVPERDVPAGGYFNPKPYSPHDMQVLIDRHFSAARKGLAPPTTASHL